MERKGYKPDSLNFDSNIHLYADDAKLFRHISTSHDDINKLTHWTDEWLIKLNINKCKVISNGRNIDHNYPYHINGVQLEQLYIYIYIYIYMNND